jgi:hypothetical protein
MLVISMACGGFRFFVIYFPDSHGRALGDRCCQRAALAMDCRCVSRPTPGRSVIQLPLSHHAASKCSCDRRMQLQVSRRRCRRHGASTATPTAKCELQQHRSAPAAPAMTAPPLRRYFHNEDSGESRFVALIAEFTNA